MIASSDQVLSFGLPTVLVIFSKTWLEGFIGQMRSSDIGQVGNYDLRSNLFNPLYTFNDLKEIAFRLEGV